MIVRVDKEALLDNQKQIIGVEGDNGSATANKPSEADKIVNSTKQKIAEGGAPAVGVSASNSGRGHDPVAVVDGDSAFVPTAIQGSVEEEPGSLSDADSDSPEVTPGRGRAGTKDTAPQPENGTLDPTA